MDRNETIKRIRQALKARSGKTWSVTGGRGTAWGWIKINAPGARCTAHYRKDPGVTTARPEDYHEVDTGVKGGHITSTDRRELAKLLNLESVHHQGVSIPASHDYWQEYIDRAEGRVPTAIGKPYWD